jgi:hypothetical protein
MAMWIPKTPRRLADGAVEDPARVVVAMCAELDDAAIVGFESLQALAACGTHGVQRLRERLI